MQRPDTTITEAPTLATATSRTVSVTVQKTAQTAQPDILEQRRQLFLQQEKAVNDYYAALFGDHHIHGEALFYLTERKDHYIESQKFKTAMYLDARDVAGIEQLRRLLDSMPVVDDLLLNVVQAMPPQRPIGWQLVSLGQNLLNLPTTTPVRNIDDTRTIEKSVAATILQFFGVACFSGDKGYFIGHILGYLFCCYYFAHLNIGYSVTPLKETIAHHYPYQWVAVPQLVRLLQQTDEALKRQVYQIAVYAAQVSDYAIDKRIEKMLITEVNSFNKQDYRDALAGFISDDETEKATLFQPIKPLK